MTPILRRICNVLRAKDATKGYDIHDVADKYMDLRRAWRCFKEADKPRGSRSNNDTGTLTLSAVDKQRLLQHPVHKDVAQSVITDGLPCGGGVTVAMFRETFSKRRLIGRHIRTAAQLIAEGDPVDTDSDASSVDDDRSIELLDENEAAYWSDYDASADDDESWQSPPPPPPIAARKSRARAPARTSLLSSTSVSRVRRSKRGFKASIHEKSVLEETGRPPWRSPRAPRGD